MALFSCKTLLKVCKTALRCQCRVADPTWVCRQVSPTQNRFRACSFLIKNDWLANQSLITIGGTFPTFPDSVTPNHGGTLLNACTYLIYFAPTAAQSLWLQLPWYSLLSCLFHLIPWNSQVLVFWRIVQFSPSPRFLRSALPAGPLMPGRAILMPDFRKLRLIHLYFAFSRRLLQSSRAWYANLCCHKSSLVQTFPRPPQHHYWYRSMRLVKGESSLDLLW